MRALLNLTTHLFHLLIRLYPAGFQDVFGEEMSQVFGEHIHQSSRDGWMPFLQAVVREIWDAPGAICSAHWHQLSSTLLPWPRSLMLQSEHLAPETRRIEMQETWTSAWQMSNNRQFISASLPPFLLGIAIAGVSVIRGGPWYAVPTWRLALSLIAPGILILAMAIIGLIALFKGIPDWGLTWVATGAMGFLLLLETGAEELAEGGISLISKTGEIVLVLVLLLGGIGFLVLLGLRGWQRAGLFTIGLSATLTLALYMSVTAAPFYRHDLAVYAAPLGLAITALCYLYVRGSNNLRAVAIMTIAILHATAPLLLNHAMREWFAKQGGSPMGLLLILLTGLLLSGPLVSLIARPLVRFIKPM